MSCLRAKQKTGVWTNFFASTGRESNPGPPPGRRVFYHRRTRTFWRYPICLHWRVLLSVYFHFQFSLQVALWGSTGSILPKFMLKLYSSRPLTKIWKNYKDENLFWRGWQGHRSCHTNEMMPLPICKLKKGSWESTSREIYAFYINLYLYSFLIFSAPPPQFIIVV